VGAGAGDRQGKKSLAGRVEEEVRLARELGVAPSRLWGREPVDRLEHYTADGELTGWTLVHRGREFTPEDVAFLLASRELEVEVGPHGIPMSEATDAANQFAFRGYTAPKVDWAEKARRDAQDAYYERYKDANRNGHLWGVTRVNPH
jgi:hypothetical protein